MELSELTVRQYCDLLGSDAPAPGGGSAAALSGAQGAALTAMVCALTLGRKKYAAFQEEAEAGFREASRLKERFLLLMQEDTDVFNSFRDAMQLPKQTPEEQTARREAMAAASVQCTQTPIKVMQTALDALCLTQTLVGKTNQNAVSDLGVAALSLMTAVKGAMLNVQINLPGLGEKPEAAVFRQTAHDVGSRAQDVCNRIFQAVDAALL